MLIFCLFETLDTIQNFDRVSHDFISSSRPLLDIYFEPGINLNQKRGLIGVSIELDPISNTTNSKSLWTSTKKDNSTHMNQIVPKSPYFLYRRSGERTTFIMCTHIMFILKYRISEVYGWLIYPQKKV